MLARLSRALLAALAVLALAAATASAEASSTITHDPVSQNISIEGDQADGYGYISTLVRAVKPIDFILVRLKPGKDTGGFANTAWKLSPQQLTRWGTLVLSGSSRKGAPYVATTSLAPGWHALLVLGREPYVAGGFTVSSEPLGIGRPEAAAVVRLGDATIDAPARLPASGFVEVVNGGRLVHDLRIARLAAGQSVAGANRLLRAGRAEKVRWAGAPRTLVGSISPGVANFVTPSLPAGRWVLVSRLAGGKAVARAVTVR